MRYSTHRWIIFIRNASSHLFFILNCGPFRRVVKGYHEIETTVFYLEGESGFLILPIAKANLLEKYHHMEMIKPNIFCEEIKQQLIFFPSSPLLN